MANSEKILETIREWLVQRGIGLLLITAITLLALKAAAALNRRLFARAFKDKTGEDSQKLAQTLAHTTHWIVSITIIAVALGLALRQLGVNMDRIADLVLAWSLTNGLGIAIILVLTFGITKIAGIFAERLVVFIRRDKMDLESQKRADTLTMVIRWVLRTGILLVASVMLLGQIGVQIGPIIAAAGVVGLAVGFGAQNLVQDVISGFFLLLEDQVRVGDVVQLNDKAGLVEKITLRMTILRDFTGSVHYVRNGKIDVVTNMTKEYSYYVFDIGVAYREDPDEVMQVIRAIGKEIQSDPLFKDEILEPIDVVGLDKFADSAIIIKARIKTKPIKQWYVGREFNRRIKRRFDELGIEIPFPHITLYPGVDKGGNAPPLKVALEGVPENSASPSERPGGINRG